ncbi:PEP/pyruvate-binding domain-containing protein [Ulvibacter antarcticus]|uniref:Phosphoenolpyruvate synthase n=1 Tax=Ulvibacter antarcticus TaxID=442714 RepID=A0A3L9YVQ7_9FLAO|nr:PEP/pyruvate-binding domain-containing protein [Ulvibacter antarcticus]RMA64756.1 pyruvate phosphate dikinase-like enzyme [Ulvibacter antarcticus]
MKIHRQRNNPLLLSLIFIFFFGISFSQELPISTIKEKIQLFKDNPRGPYKGINWFCEDGTVREARDPCPGKLEGVQHASYRDDTKDLAKKHHLFFGEILASTDRTAFWDEENNHSRLKQYQINKYLESVDDGWIQRKSQFYRGALQIEDEQAWGVEFYEKFLPRDERITNNYFLLKQSLKDIPHDGDSNLSQLMRSQSKTVADEFPKFMDARIKIHGNPTVEDVEMVKNFQLKYEKDLSAKLKNELEELQNTMAEIYAPLNTANLKVQVSKISKSNSTRQRLLEFLEGYSDVESPEQMVPALADILCVIRTDITEKSTGNDRLLLLDLSNAFEDVLLKKTQEWQPDTLLGLMEKIRHLSLAAAGTGLIELWEWHKIEPLLESHLNKTELSIEELNQFLQTSRGVVEWSAAMVKANYQEVVDTYTAFEPMSYGFIDDRIRSTVALDLGETVSRLGGKIAQISAMTNNVMNLRSQSSFRGLNPGYALGELVVIEESPENIDIDSDKIYIFQKPPSDLKPVAGIMTVSEGNLVSHVQLLARNLGIPNAALSGDNLKSLSKYNGKKVFYAVSEKGNVILKSEDDMSNEEQELFSKKERNTEKIAVPVEQIRLDVCEVLNMRDVGASDSGKLCGPKAANLGELKTMFPENVVEGVVIPFGIFRKHMDQEMPSEGVSFWTYLNTTFSEADYKRQNGVNENEVENYQLIRLEKLKNAIYKMPLDEQFVTDLEKKFNKAFGSAIGTVPVFLRSDTNMEDLKEFTGAGLNLTLFNILTRDNIMEGIKKVWASPYTERSFKWRQKYLSNPENVYPSILIIPSVDVEYSGVLITKGINSGNDSDLTVAFSRGAGGAVDGQSAETRLVTAKEDYLLAPAREGNYLRLPKTGGTTNNRTTFEGPILNEKNIKDIRDMANRVRTTMASEGEDANKGAWDVELGFQNDKLWLFQIRPFVENKRAKSSDYLASITPKIDYSKKISLATKI